MYSRIRQKQACSEKSYNPFSVLAKGMGHGWLLVRRILNEINLSSLLLNQFQPELAKNKLLRVSGENRTRRKTLHQPVWFLFRETAT